MKNTKPNNSKFAVEVIDSILHTGVNSVSIFDCDGDRTAIIKDEDGDITIVQESCSGDIAKTRLYEPELNELKKIIGE